VGFQRRRPTVDQVSLLTQILRIAFRQGRPELCWSISEQPATLYGIAAPRASYCDCNLQHRYMVRIIIELIGTGSFTLTTSDNKQIRLRRLKKASHRDPSWYPFCSTSTPLTYQSPSPERRRTPTI